MRVNAEEIPSRLRYMAKMAFGWDDDLLDLWFQAPHPDLDSWTPMEMINRGERGRVEFIFRKILWHFGI